MSKHYSASCYCLGTVYHTVVLSSWPTGHNWQGQVRWICRLWCKTAIPKDASVPVVWWLVCELALPCNKAFAVPISLCTVTAFPNESEWWCCRMSRFLVVPQGSQSTIRTPSMSQMTMSTCLSVKGVVKNFFRQGLLSCFHYTAFSLQEWR